MATTFHSRKNVNFLLYDVHNAEALTEFPYYADHNKETFDLTLDATTQIAETIMFPNLTSVDRNEPQLKDGNVTVHPSIRSYLKAIGDAGIIGADFEYEHGGAQLPFMVTSMVGYILMAANNGMMYSGLTTGAARLITTFGSADLKEAYVPNLLNGKWQGTMCLTEPQAGSSLSDITMTAELQADGSYQLTGQKIFISGGDHNACENVIHLAIARIKGAPLGTKGISLFLIPKIKLNGETNAITNMGIYHKIGQKGVPAMHLGFDGSEGYLVGTENKGLAQMFQMMNEARIGVGLTGAAIASAAYYASLEYAKERPQSRRLNQKSALDSPQVNIIQHPDVRRMLLFQKAVVEGSLSLLMQAANYYDKAHASTNAEEKENSHLLLELLTPIAKTYPCEAGTRAVSEGLQCFGGYGFTTDFPAEQYYRDIRITPIYEGTTGIQSQDLLGRKVIMNNGKAMQLLAEEIKATLLSAQKHENLQQYAAILEKEMQRLQEVTMHLMGIAQTGDVERFLSDATLYMELFSITTIAWQWLKQGVVANEKLGNEDTEFYESKLQTMKYYFHYEVPKNVSLAIRLKDSEVLTIFSEKEILM